MSKRLKKGSPEAKAWGAKMAAKRKPKNDNVTSSVLGNTTLKEEETQLTIELQEGMLTKAEMKKTPPGGIHKHINWEKKNYDKIHRWKEIRHELYPDDYNAGNLENIRPLGVIEVK